MIGFLLFTFFFNSLVILIEYIVNQHLNNYEIVMQSFIHLNDTADQVDKIMKLLNQYLSRGYGHDRETLELALSQLKLSLGSLDTNLLHSSDGIYRLENLKNLLNEFMKQVEDSVSDYQAEKVDLYTYHYNQATQDAGFITDYTRNLMSFAFSSYRTEIEHLTKSKELIKPMGESIFFVSIILSILFSLFVYYGISEPIRNLVRRSKRISSGDFNVDDMKVDRKDEIGVLMQAYAVMGQNIDNLLKEIKSQEEYKRLLREMELKSLQSQINPHFLFNTLNIISRIAYMEQAPKTEELMGSLASLLRYNLKKAEQKVTLREELYIVHQYLYIQKTRFQERIHVEIEVDESCLDTEMPSLTLQPLVENIFVHGIESYESDAYISLKIYNSNERVIVEIFDNGIGMSKETIDHILHESPGGKTERVSLGLRNVIRRLEIFYNKNQVVTIESELKQGTRIKLCLPKQRIVA